MTRNITSGFFILILAGLISTDLSAQLGGSFDLSTSYDDNIYISAVKTGDLITDVDFSLDYTLKDSATSIFINTDILLYQANTIRNLVHNSAGVNYYRPLGEQFKHDLYLGTIINTRHNTEAYNYYNYQQLYAYANQRFSLNKTYLKTGYNFRFRNYSNFGELSNFRHYLFMQLSRTFSTRTSVILESDYGFKSFRQVTGEGTVSEKIPNLSHLIVMGRVAQSLHDRVGIYFQYKHQFNLSKDAASINSSDYYHDEELFDDPFSYSSSSVSSRLTILLPLSMNLKMGGSLESKDYITEKAYISAEDIDGAGDLRMDKKQNIYLNFSKTFALNKKHLHNIKTYLNYTFVNNRSNSYWYNYNYNYAGIGAVVNF